MSRTLRVPAVLLSVGYIGVIYGMIAWLMVPGFTVPEVLIWNVATTLAYGVAGFACWRWVRTSVASGTGTPSRGPARWMASASALMAVGFGAITWYDHRMHREDFSHGAVYQPHYHLQLAGGAAYVAGFLLAAVGFWLASNATAPSASDQQVAVATL